MITSKLWSIVTRICRSPWAQDTRTFRRIQKVPNNYIYIYMKSQWVSVKVQKVFTNKLQQRVKRLLWIFAFTHNWELCCFCKFNFYTTCVEVANLTSTQVAAKWFFNFCPSWAEVGFWTSDQLGRKLFFMPDKLSGSWFQKFCPTWAELFFCVFSWRQF